MTTTTKHITADQLLDGDYTHCELIAGEIVQMSPTGTEHGDVEGEIAFVLKCFIGPRKLGRVIVGEGGFILSRNPDTVLAPDVAFISQARYVKSRRFYEGPPDLAVEVISPSDRASDVAAKVARWIAAGTRSVWTVDPISRSITMYLADGQSKRFRFEDTLRDEPTLPGFAVELAKIFID